jgi:hypothetical protein
METTSRAANVLLLCLALLVPLSCGNRTAPSPRSGGSTTNSPGPRSILHAEDAADDVTSTRHPGLATELRQGIDLHDLLVSRHGEHIRFTVGVERIDRSTRLTQIYLVGIDAPGFDGGQLTVATHSLRVPPGKDDLEHSIVLEGAEAPEEYVQCEDLQFSLGDGDDSWWVDVPPRCLPKAPVSLKVYAQTTPGPGGDETIDQWSHDTLRVPGHHSLGGTARPAHR